MGLEGREVLASRIRPVEDWSESDQVEAVCAEAIACPIDRLSCIVLTLIGLLRFRS